MKKIIISIVFLVLMIAQASFGICGNISKSSGRFYISMAGGGNAQLYARDTIFFKPLSKLETRVGHYTCLDGEWINSYLFEVIRVN